MENNRNNNAGINNLARLRGFISKPFEFSFESTKGEKFYRGEIFVTRLSGAEDYLPIVVSERLAPESFTVGKVISITGCFRTRKTDQGTYDRYVYAKGVRLYPDTSEIGEYIEQNCIKLIGTVCQELELRSTPLGRVICDIPLRVETGTDFFDIVPCIAWGKKAYTLVNLMKGEKVEIEGRIQSRTYQKPTEDFKRTFVEVSISDFKIM